MCTQRHLNSAYFSQHNVICGTSTLIATTYQFYFISIKNEKLSGRLLFNRSRRYEVIITMQTERRWE
ncbi:unnamed protein product [Rotaria socialis]